MINTILKVLQGILDVIDLIKKKRLENAIKKASAKDQKAIDELNDLADK